MGCQGDSVFVVGVACGGDREGEGSGECGGDEGDGESGGDGGEDRLSERWRRRGVGGISHLKEAAQKDRQRTAGVVRG